MDVYELIEKVGAEIVSNKATARIDGAFVVVAEVAGDGMVLTDDGKALAEKLKPAPKAKTAKSKAAEPADEA